MKKICSSLFEFEYPWLFSVCAIVSVLVCCSTGEAVVIDAHGMTVMELLKHSQYIQKVSAYDACNAGISGWFFILLPAISSLVPIAYFCDEINKGYWQYCVGREGLLHYLTRKYIKVAMYGFVIVFLGLFLYFLLVYWIFPRTASYMSAVQSYENQVSVWSEFFMLVQDALPIVFWGTALAVMSYVIALFVHNKYIVISIPVFMNYVLRDFIWQHMLAAVISVVVLSYVICVVRSKRSFL